MKPKLLSPGRLIITLLFITFCFGVYWIFSPKFVRDELLTQIKPGMTLKSAKSILGSSWPSNDIRMWGPATPHGGMVLEDYQREWTLELLSLQLRAFAPDGSHPIDRDLQRHFWVSDKQRLLWVEARESAIIHVWIVDLWSIEKR